MKAKVLFLVFLATIFVIEDVLGGFCFDKYNDKTKSCRRLQRSKGKKISFEECCKNGGSGGWAARKKGRKGHCKPCTAIKIYTSYWGDWGVWSSCSATCGASYKRRIRTCISKGKPNCQGRAEERKKCDRKPCPVDGSWTEWSSWSACSKSCGAGHRLRRRSCANPKPQHGGKECKGSYEKWEDCQVQQHCPVDGDWGVWGSWSTCSVSCDLGTKRRTRKCDNPKPKHGGKPCDPVEATGIQYCREERCGKTSVGCDDPDMCASGSGSGWGSSGSGSASGEGSGSGSGEGSGEGSGGEGSGGDGSGKGASIRRKKPKILDDEDL